MAIIFNKDLSTTELINSHNNNIVEFESNNALTAVSCVVDFNGVVSPTITPNPDGVFSYNLRGVVKTLINENNYKDNILPDFLTLGYVYSDFTIQENITVTYTITLEGGTTETVARTYNFIKSKKQDQKYADTIADTNLIFLLPFDGTSQVSYNATYFEGFPFDVSLYSDEARTITVKNKTTNLETILELSKGVNRIYFSQGSQTETFEDILTLVYGINDLEFTVTPGNYVTLLLDKQHSLCAPYLKFYSSYGGYAYIRFNRVYKESYTTKTLDTITKDFEDITTTFGSEFITGKQSKATKKLIAEGLTKTQLDYVLNVIDSPRVEMYLEPLFQKVNTDSYNVVKVKDATYNLIDTKRVLYNLSLEIEYKRNTMIL